VVRTMVGANAAVRLLIVSSLRRRRAVAYAAVFLKYVLSRWLDFRRSIPAEPPAATAGAPEPARRAAPRLPCRSGDGC
jgi:hypothetical protein